MNRNDKPKLTSGCLIKKLKDEKGVTFKYIDEIHVEDFLKFRNNYMRTASYRKNYQKYTMGKNQGKYLNLDFAYLKEMSILDMHLRDLVVRMCIDIEHDLKVRLLNDVEAQSAENGYNIVDGFLGKYTHIVEKIAATASSPYTSGLTDKYFTVVQRLNLNTNKMENKITDIDCPVWVLVELLTFGDFMKLYSYYYTQKLNPPVNYKILNLVRNLRNACAHNNCILADLTPGSSVAPVEIYNAVKNVSTINQNQRKKKLSNRVVMEFVCMLYIYNKVVSERVKYHRILEMKQFFLGRAIEKASYFETNNLISSTYEFIFKIIEAWYGK